LFSVATLLFGFLIGHFLAIGRDRRKEFNATSGEFRKVFNQTLAEIQSDKFNFGLLVSADILKIHRIAYLNFRPHLYRICHRQYDEAWNQYCYNLNRFDCITIQEDINSLVKFTEYGIFKNIFAVFVKLWRKIRLKVFGPSEEIKKLVNEFNESQNKTSGP